MTSLFVNEIFWSIQGEGSQSGRPSIFIRLQGCLNACPWCDTRYAQALPTLKGKDQNQELVFNKKEPSEAYSLLEVDVICAKIKELPTAAKLVVLTGGEPCRQDLTLITTLLLRDGFACQIETSGSEPIKCHKDTWVTLSPKACGVYAPNWARANEIKLPVANLQDITRYAKELAEIKTKKIWLQPVDCNQDATELCVKICQERNWNLSIQMHKYINIK